MISINTRSTGYGHCNVIVTKDFDQIGIFETTDMCLIEDIREMNRDLIDGTGFESNLQTHDTFGEVQETVLSKIKR